MFSSPRYTAARSGSAHLSAMKPSVAVRPVRSSRADSFRRKPRASIAPSTRLVVSGVTPGSRFTTRDTVLSATPARVATSFMVGRPPPRLVSPDTGPLLFTVFTWLLIDPPSYQFAQHRPPGHLPHREIA